MTALLFDFFGTLVDYSPGHTTQDFSGSHALVPHLSYRGFLSALGDRFAAFERRSDADDSEFSMDEVVADFLCTIGSTADPVLFAGTYLAEWQTGVRVPDGLTGLLEQLRRRHRLAIVSNTNDRSMVPGYLADWGVAELFDTVVLSVDVGWRKPHPQIYRTALDRIGVPAGEAVFIGDSYVADFQGPAAQGIAAYLIDPQARAPVPAERRISSIFDLPALLG